MKLRKPLALLLLLTVVLSLCSCGGNVSGVKIIPAASDIYTQKDISDAVSVIIREFAAGWSHCTLLSIGYIGDDYDKEVEPFDHWAKLYGADEAIMLISGFYVDKNARDDPNNTFNEDTVYDNWNWILVRNKGGMWRHMDHGY